MECDQRPGLPPRSQSLRLSSRLSSRRAAKRRAASSWCAKPDDNEVLPRSPPLHAHRLPPWTPPPEMRGRAPSPPPHGWSLTRKPNGTLTREARTLLAPARQEATFSSSGLSTRMGGGRGHAAAAGASSLGGRAEPHQHAAHSHGRPAAT